MPLAHTRNGQTTLSARFARLGWRSRVSRVSYDPGSSADLRSRPPCRAGGGGVGALAAAGPPFRSRRYRLRPRVLGGVLVKGGLAAALAETVGFTVVLGLFDDCLLVHVHPTYWIPCHFHVLLALIWSPPSVAEYCDSSCPSTLDLTLPPMRSEGRQVADALVPSNRSPPFMRMEGRWRMPVCHGSRQALAGRA